MNFKSFVTTRDAFFVTPVVFFWIICAFVIGFCVLIILPNTPQFRVVENEPVAGFFLLYLISFCGSVKLLNSFPEKPSFRKFIIPFCLVTASGILLCIIKCVSHGTLYEWPLVPFSDLLLNLINLILTPAITLLLYPFAKEMKTLPTFFLGCLALLSLVSAGMAIFILIGDILPVFDPEFIWSKLWDFGIANMFVSLLYELYIVFGMPIVGLLSIFVISGYLSNNPSSEGGR